jgi:beta-phosphoglucomutase-like phosphatase (HAD superfamily)
MLDMRACLFDLDGTLVDTERENAASIEVVLAERGRPMTEEERLFVVGHGWREIYEHLRAAGGVDLSFDELKERAARAKEEMVTRSGLRTVAGAVEFVRAAARATGGRCAVVSGSSRREIDFCLRTLGLAPQGAAGDGEVRLFVGAEDVPRGKPAPDGYLLAAQRLKVDPGACLVFEDSAAGIAAARAAGMRCVAISAANFAGEDQGAADERVADFAAAAAWSALERHVGPSLGVARDERGG